MVPLNYKVLNEKTNKDFKFKSIEKVVVYIYTGNDPWTPKYYVTYDHDVYNFQDLNDANDDNIVFSASFGRAYEYDTYEELLECPVLYI